MYHSVKGQFEIDLYDNTWLSQGITTELPRLKKATDLSGKYYNCLPINDGQTVA